jgi:hypothetical protein
MLVLVIHPLSDVLDIFQQYLSILIKIAKNVPGLAEKTFKLALENVQEVDLGVKPLVIQFEVDVRDDDVVSDVFHQAADELDVLLVLVVDDAIVKLVSEPVGVAFEIHPIVLAQLVGRMDAQHADDVAAGGEGELAYQIMVALYGRKEKIVADNGLLRKK